MNDYQIVKNAPEGATHYDGTYYRYEAYEHGQAYLIMKNGSWVRGTLSPKEPQVEAFLEVGEYDGEKFENEQSVVILVCSTCDHEMIDLS